MIVKCPYCERTLTVNGLGRKRLDIPLNNVCESLQVYKDVVAAAKELHCSQGYIYGVLKANDLKVKDVVNGKGLATKDGTLLNRGDGWAKQ